MTQRYSAFAGEDMKHLQDKLLQAEEQVLCDHVLAVVIVRLCLGLGTILDINKTVVCYLLLSGMDLSAVNLLFMSFLYILLHEL